MSVEQLLSKLRALDVRMNVEGDLLRCSAPSGSLTKELQSSIARHKAEIIQALRVPATTSASVLRRSLPGVRLPLSFAQERFWFQQNLEPESTAYNITASRRFQSPLRADELKSAVCTLVERHEILRTGFVEADGVPAQIIHENLSPDFEIHDLALLAETEQAKAVEHTIREFGARPFDLANGRVFRVALIRFSERDHYVVLATHHIVCDGWSLGICFAELCSLYEAALHGRREELHELPVQYGDYAIWERERLSLEVLAPQTEYWKSKLEGAPTCLEIPLDHPRTLSAEYQPGRCSFQLDVATSKALKQLAQESAATPFMTLLAVFKALLARYTNQEDIVVSTPVSTRTLSELEGLIGCFINVHLLRTAVSQEITARQLVTSVRGTVIEALSHGEVPFETLVRALVIGRDPIRSPLSQIAFVLLNTANAQEYEVVSGGTRLDMTLYMWETEDRFQGSLEYDRGLYDPATIACFAGCFQTLAAQMANQPDAPLHRFGLMTPDQEAQWFGRHQGPEVKIPDICTHEWIQRQMAATPDKIAVVCEKERLTFRDLWQRSTCLAHRLRAMGVKRGDLVALCLNRAANLVVAPLAAWLAGGAYVPLDPDYPEGRLAFMLEDAGASVLITESQLLERLPNKLPPHICLDRDSLEQPDESDLSPVESATPDDLAYVIYTSGSTGKPKGVEVCHRSLVNFLGSMQREPGICPTDRLLAVTTLSFDIAALELFLPLVSGAQVVIAPRSAVADGEALAHLLTEFDITVMQATPATWRLLIESGWRGKPGLKILCGGEALSRDLAEQLTATGAELWNLYGPTETTIWSTLKRIENGDSRISMGRPIANAQAYVRDERGYPLPVGLTGEIFISGEGLARGYRNREALSAERFVEGVSYHPACRQYRTGDLARRLPDGDLEYVGRVDDQVKIRGHRIELGEIERVLEGHPDVKQAIVAVREVKPGEKSLVAYWTARNHVVPDVAELRKSLRKILPEVMVPANYVRLDRFPLTTNHKVDRKALPSAEFRTNLRRKVAEENRQRKGKLHAKEELPVPNYDAPANYVEMVMEGIWRDVLEIEKIGVHANLFELGGHSLTATQIVSRVREELDMDLPLRSIFVYPTIAGLASHISFEPSNRRYSYTSELPQWKSLVPAQPQGSRTPLFFIAGYQNPDDALLVLSRLIPHLGKDQPVFGFRPRWAAGDGDVYATVEDMAREYLVELREIQPSGPYLLGGYCLDGITALEMARLLEQEGEEVKLLALVDTERSTLARVIRMNLLFFMERLIHIKDVLAELTQAKGGARVRMIGRLIARKLGASGSAEEREKDRFFQCKVRYRRLLYNHTPARWPGRITLIGNEEGMRRDHDFGWGGYFEGGVDIHMVPGDHDTILTEHGNKLAQIILKSIDEALGEAEIQMKSGEVEVL